MPTPLDPAGLARLPAEVNEIFQEVQGSVINHQKNCVKLFKIHDSAQATFKESERGDRRLIGGHIFEKAVLHCLYTTLFHDDAKCDALIKLVAKFTGAYFEFVNKRGTLNISTLILVVLSCCITHLAFGEYKCQVEREEIEEETPESVEMGRALIPGFKFTACILREFILKGLVTGPKAPRESVRHGILQFLTELLRSARFLL